jgi:hypothetical protein
VIFTASYGPAGALLPETKSRSMTTAGESVPRALVEDPVGA